MKYQACIISKDTAFSQFVRLTLLSRLRTVAVTDDASDAPASEVYVVDTDTCPVPTHPTGEVLCTYYGTPAPAAAGYKCLERPFRPNRLLAILGLAGDEAEEYVHLLPDGTSVTVGSETVSLSKREAQVLRLLWNAKGAYVSREDILKEVWGGEDADPGQVNVYIHYLRNKIEIGGQKLILSSRGRGYALLCNREEGKE